MLKIILLCIVYLLVSHRGDARTAENLRVQLNDGSKLLGRYLTSDSGKGIRAFLGVPYAEAPLNELRFKVRFLTFKVDFLNDS